MGKQAVLLKPGQRLEGTVRMDTTLFGGLKPGAYRIEAVLYGWSDKDFSQEQGNRCASSLQRARGERENGPRTRWRYLKTSLQ